MAKSSFSPIRTNDADLTRVQQLVAAALEDLAGQIPRVPTLVSFVTTGANGVGVVQLPPVKDAAQRVLRRANIGARLVAAVDLTSVPPADMQTSFEQSVSVPDQLKQTTTANLSAKTLLIVVAA